MLFGSANMRVDKFLKKNPEVKTVVITGTFGHTSAIRALGIILGQQFTVTMGVNPKVKPDIALFDYKQPADFPTNIQPDAVVITSCASQEEANLYFEIANRAKAVFVNYADVPQEYAKLLSNAEVTTYGDELPADYYFENQSATINGQDGDIVNPERERFPATIKLIGEHNLRPVAMSVAVAKYFGEERERILMGVNEITPTRGRLSPAKGMRGSVVIDDSADISGYSIKLGLRAIYAIEAPSRIIIIDDANKLNGLNIDMLSEVLVLNPMQNADMPKFKFFADDLALMNYLGGRLEENGIVLLEIPLPDIIESYIW